ncbi:TIM44-like domain-containing protein [Paucibacter sp. APW11]|uniref:TIM44-like domain-containing protein n=1 Tax=Roseateles aquae TaxID=3077235 RepID=A0ABU3P8Y0_9BURK|nr:TIM44-like domain-containing protein [Paucibacter sp. APW11]MDT8999040.1 TIM44-like domain-containing protein [Paucibacter sp. APW11]
MKRLLVTLLSLTLTLGLLGPVEAKRLGGGGSSGMKRTPPPATAPHETPKPAPQPSAAPQQAATPPAAAAAPAPKRNWLGPIAGIAAGLGIAALASHFGLGGALANVMTIALIGFALMALIGWLMRRRAAASGAPAGLQFAGMPAAPQTGTAAWQPAAAPAATDGFDTAGFEQLAKRVFIRLQAANDTGDQNDLRKFTTPEMYAAIQQDLLERRGAAQSTEVLQLDARVIERAQEQGQQIVSVRFWGQLREQQGAAPESFDEIWHLLRPLDGSRDWAIAGIQQSQ